MLKGQVLGKLDWKEPRSQHAVFPQLSVFLAKVKKNKTNINVFTGSAFYFISSQLPAEPRLQGSASTVGGFAHLLSNGIDASPCGFSRMKHAENTFVL